MKIKRLMTVIVGVAMCGTFLASCGKVDGPTVGILKWVSASALNEAERGFIDGLKEGGYVPGQNLNVSYENANDKPADAITQAQKLLRNSDITLGIATPAAQALQAQSLELGLEKPILFTAVTDPVGAELVASEARPGGFITGTSDLNPIEEQIELIKECLPGINTLGVCYNQSEQNSRVQAERAQAKAEAEGIAVRVSTISSAAEIQTTINSLSQSVDALYIPTDNTLADNMPTVFASANNKLICTGEANQVANGGHVSLSIDYYKLGKTTGLMAARILDGADPATMPVQKQPAEELEYVYSSVNCRESNISLPASVINKSRDVNA